jgi:diadenosine hexaphosphate hydrolase (ATP-forming)
VSRRVVEGAGGVVRNARGDVLLIRYPRSRGGTWTFPKGHVEPGETLEQTAVREVLEEGGVRVEILAPLGTTEYVNARGTPRRIHWFAMRTNATRATPEAGFSAGFYTAEHALKHLSHAENRALLERALALDEERTP